VGGVQREATKKRINEIAEYCQTADEAFPTAVILAVPEQHYQLSPDESTIEFNGAAPFADIVDGQHRLLGLEASGVANAFSLPVVLLLDATQQQEALLFATINGKQNKVNAFFIYDLFEVTESRSPQKTAHEVARVLNSKIDSPWFERLKMLGRKSSLGSSESITQGTFARELLAHLSSNPSADFDAARRGRSLPSDPKSPVLRPYFIENNDAIIVRLLMNLFGAQKSVWPQEWEHPAESILRKTTGFMATMWALDRLVGRGEQQKSLTQLTFEAIFRIVAERMQKEQIALTAEYFPSSASGIQRLRDYFIHASVG